MWPFKKKEVQEEKKVEARNFEVGEDVKEHRKEVSRRRKEGNRVFEIIADFIHSDLGLGVPISQGHSSRPRLWLRYRIATSYDYPMFKVFPLISKKGKNVADTTRLLLRYNWRYNESIEYYHPGSWSELLLKEAHELRLLAEKKEEEEKIVREERERKELEDKFSSIDY